MSKSGNFAKAGRIYDMAQPFGSSCRVKKERIIIRARDAASRVVTNVKSEQVQGLRSRTRLRVLDDAMSQDLLDLLGESRASKFY